MGAGAEPSRSSSGCAHCVFFEGARGCELLRGLIFQAAVRSLRIVVDPPVFDDLAGFADAGEPMLVQALLSVAAIETLDVGVLRWLARVDEIQLDAVIIGPSIQRSPAQFRAIIDDQDIGVSSLTGHAFQHLDHPFSRQREIYLDRRALPGAVVLEVGSAELAAIGQSIAGEVERPTLVGRNRAPGALSPLARDLLALCAAQPQSFFAVEALDDLDVHPEALADEFGMQHAIPIPPVLA